MTKAELTRFLEPFKDDTEIVVSNKRYALNTNIVYQPPTNTETARVALEIDAHFYWSSGTNVLWHE